MGYFAYFLSAVQIISLIVLIITIRLPEEANHGFSKEDEFTIGSKENIIIFIADTLQASVLEEYITSDAYPTGQLNDFTFFDRAVSGGAPTELAMPLLLTGEEYDPMQPINEYREEIWQDAPFYDYPKFGIQLYKLANFYLMPQFLKEYFLLSTDDLMNTIQNSDNTFEIDNYKFYLDVLAAGELIPLLSSNSFKAL